MIRKPRRDMRRPQAPIPGWEAGWESRWRTIWARQRVREKGLSGVAELNEMLKVIYSRERPPGSPPAKPQRHSFETLIPGLTRLS